MENLDKYICVAIYPQATTCKILHPSNKFQVFLHKIHDLYYAQYWGEVGGGREKRGGVDYDSLVLLHHSSIHQDTEELV